MKRKEDLLKTPVPDTWQDLTVKLQSKLLCVKPARDGCSTGVAKLWLVLLSLKIYISVKISIITLHFFYSYSCCEDLELYLKALENCLPRIPPNSLSQVKFYLSLTYM